VSAPSVESGSRDGCSIPLVFSGHLHSDADPLYADRIRVHYQTMLKAFAQSLMPEIFSAAFALMI